MSHLVSPAGQIAAALRTPPGNIAGLVDALVAAAPVQLTWDGGSCVIRSGAGDVAAPLSRPAFRAVIARAAALCNESAPNTVSPYSGEGVIESGGRRVRAEFVNTMHEQRLDLAPA